MGSPPPNITLVSVVVKADKEQIALVGERDGRIRWLGVDAGTVLVQVDGAVQPPLRW